jgi:hypothetical protein
VHLERELEKSDDMQEKKDKTWKLIVKMKVTVGEDQLLLLLHLHSEHETKAGKRKRKKGFDCQACAEDVEYTARVLT